MLSTLESINAALKYKYKKNNSELAIKIYDHYKVFEDFEKKNKISKWLKYKKEKLTGNLWFKFLQIRNRK